MDKETSAELGRLHDIIIELKKENKALKEIMSKAKRVLDLVK